MNSSIDKNKPSLSVGIVQSIFTVKYSSEEEKEKQKQSIIDDFQAYKKLIGDNAPYPEITEYIFYNSIVEIDSMIEQIENLGIQEDGFSDFFKSFKKHATLATIQQDYIKKNSQEAWRLAEKAQQQIKKVEEMKGNLYTEFIAILGIFSALIFGLFGGFSGLSEAIVSLSSKWSMGRVLIISSGIMLCLTLLIFGLLQWVARITDRKLTSCDCYKKEEQCNHSMFQRHRTLFSLVFSFIFIFILGEYIETYENIAGINVFKENHQQIFKALVWGVPIVAIILIVFVLYKVLKKPNFNLFKALKKFTLFS